MKRNFDLIIVLSSILIIGCKASTAPKKAVGNTPSVSEVKSKSSLANPTGSKRTSNSLKSAVNSGADSTLPTLLIPKNIRENVADEIELIVDPYFSRGVSVIPACKNPDSDPNCANGTPYDIINPYGVRGAKPLWSLGQWGSRTSLPHTGAYANGGFSYFDATKSLTFAPNGEMILAVNGESEFNGKYGEGVGLILGHNVSAPGENQHESGTLDQMSSLKFNIDMQLLYSVQNIKPGYDVTKHAVIFPINFTIQNLNRSSPGYGQYVWFQIMSYGDRGIANDYYKELDIASSSFIYAIPDMMFATKSVRTGELVHLSADILADAKQSVKDGVQKGFLKSANLSDYHIGGLNIGFELTGMNISTIVFSNFSLKARKLTANSPLPAPTPVPAAPSPAPAAPEQNLAAGYYRIGNTDGIYYVNGMGGSCTFIAWETFLKWGGKSDASNVKSVPSFPKNQISYGACQ